MLYLLGWATWLDASETGDETPRAISTTGERLLAVNWSQLIFSSGHSQDARIVHKGAPLNFCSPCLEATGAEAAYIGQLQLDVVQTSSELTLRHNSDECALHRLKGSFKVADVNTCGEALVVREQEDTTVEVWSSLSIEASAAPQVRYSLPGRLRVQTSAAGASNFALLTNTSVYTLARNHFGEAGTTDDPLEGGHGDSGGGEPQLRLVDFFEGLRPRCVRAHGHCVAVLTEARDVYVWGSHPALHSPSGEPQLVEFPEMYGEVNDVQLSASQMLITTVAGELYLAGSVPHDPFSDSKPTAFRKVDTSNVAGRVQRVHSTPDAFVIETK